MAVNTGIGLTPQEFYYYAAGVTGILGSFAGRSNDLPVGTIIRSGQAAAQTTHIATSDTLGFVIVNGTTPKSKPLLNTRMYLIYSLLIARRRLILQTLMEQV